MKKEQYFVRVKVRGLWKNVDILDLDELSFRALVLDRLNIARLLIGIKEEFLPGEEIELKVKPELENKYIMVQDEEERNN